MAHRNKDGVERCYAWANKAYDGAPSWGKVIVEAVLGTIPVTHNLLRYRDPYFDILASSRKHAPVIIRFHFEMGRAICDFVADHCWHKYKDLCMSGVFAPLGFKGDDLHEIATVCRRRAALRAAARAALGYDRYYGALINYAEYGVDRKGDYVRTSGMHEPPFSSARLEFKDIQKYLARHGEGATPTVVVEKSGLTHLTMRSGSRYVVVSDQPFWAPQCRLGADMEDCYLQSAVAYYLWTDRDHYSPLLVDVERR